MPTGRISEQPLVSIMTQATGRLMGSICLSAGPYQAYPYVCFLQSRGSDFTLFSCSSCHICPGHQPFAPALPPHSDSLLPAPSSLLHEQTFLLHPAQLWISHHRCYFCCIIWGTICLVSCTPCRRKRDRFWHPQFVAGVPYYLIAYECSIATTSNFF